MGSGDKDKPGMAGFDNAAFTGDHDVSIISNGHTKVGENGTYRNGVHTTQPNGYSQHAVRSRSTTSQKDGDCRSPGLAYCLPVRCEKRSKNEMPVNTVGCLRYVSASWVMSMLWKACRAQKTGPLKSQDVWDASRCDTADVNCDRLEKLWAAEVKKNGDKASFLAVWWRFIRVRFFVSCITLMLCLGCMFMSSVWTIRRTLEYLEEPVDNDMGAGIGIVLGLLVAEIGRGLMFSGTWMINHHQAMRLKSAIAAMLYKKVLRTSTLQTNAVGELVNLVSQDSVRIFEATSMLVLILAAPTALAVGVGYSCYIIGPWALVGCLVFIITFIIQTRIAKLIGNLRQKCVTIADKRVRLMSEILNNVKMIKMYSWCESFASKIIGIRNEEKKILSTAGILQSFVFSLMVLAPVAAAVVTFALHTMTGNNLTAPQAFTLIAIFSYVRAMLTILPNAVRAVSEAKVSFGRLQKVLLLPEGGLASSHAVPHALDPSTALCFMDTTFRWPVTNTGAEHAKGKKKNGKSTTVDKMETVDEERMFALENINLQVKQGQLVGICGPVGSGKTALLSSMLGELNKTDGDYNNSLQASIGYVPQQAWIINGTVKENIIFGGDFNTTRYDHVLNACGLKRDIQSLPAGDETEIGERGVNLSGGQKQRLSLARALYSNRDLYLLDDTLSAVDSNMAHHIFSSCIETSLAAKTVLFVTHNIKFLSKCHQVMVMKGGRIQECDTHDNLMSQNGEYAQLVHKWDSSQDNDQSPDDANSSETSQSSTQQGSGPGGNGSNGTLVKEEGMGKARASTKTLMAYFRFGGWIRTCFLCLTYMLLIACSTFSNWWLSYWLEQSSKVASYNMTTDGDDDGDEDVTVHHTDVSQDPNLQFYLGIYGATAGGILLFAIIKAYFFAKMSVGSAITLHEKVLRRVLTCPMSFFDTTPAGRILNRFSKDQDEVDTRLPFSMDMLMQNLLLILASLIVIGFVYPWFLVAVVPLVIIFVLINLVLAPGIRNLKRIDNVSLSPVISQLTATIHGRSTIVSMNRQEMFYKKFTSLVDKNSASVFMFYSGTRWLGFCLDLFTALLVTTTALFVVLTKGTIPASLAGLALTYAMQVTGIIQFTVRLKSETESKLISAERIFEYLVKLPSELSAIESDKLTPGDWPGEGAISMDSVSMRYHPDKPLALDDVTMNIRHNEKIGIVGRTGSGKSTLVSMLFRLVEPTTGHISVDGVKISDVQLDYLRSRLSAIPQDPVLFSGTVRYNLDPFSKHDDEALWDSLAQAQIKDKILALPHKLDEMVEENGDNFSVGERQLFCLCRAILRKSRILVLDEATASVDVETDSQIQRTVDKAFRDHTVITIAHRLNTVLHCDRIAVMDRGKIIEFDSPGVLLNNPNTQFYQMVSTQGHQIPQTLQNTSLSSGATVSESLSPNDIATLGSSTDTEIENSADNEPSKKNIADEQNDNVLEEKQEHHDSENIPTKTVPEHLVKSVQVDEVKEDSVAVIVDVDSETDLAALGDNCTKL